MTTTIHYVYPQPFLAEDDDEAALAAVAMQIIMSTTIFGTFGMDVNINDTVEDLKAKVLSWCPVDVLDIRFFFAGNVLDEGRNALLTSFGIRDQSLLLMEMKQDVIILTLTDDTTTTMECWPTTTIAVLKLSLENPIPAHRRRLVFNGNLLDDDKTLQHYDNVNGSTA
jgi:hypothetical protein